MGAPAEVLHIFFGVPVLCASRPIGASRRR